MMDGTPGDVDLGEVTKALEAQAGVENAHHVHAWALTSGKYVFSAHLLKREGSDPQEVLEQAHKLLRDQFGFYFATLQVETKCLDEGTAAAIDVTGKGSDG